MKKLFSFFKNKETLELFSTGLLISGAGIFCQHLNALKQERIMKFKSAYPYIQPPTKQHNSTMTPGKST